MRPFKCAIAVGVLFLTLLCGATQAAECVGVELVKLRTIDGIELIGALREPQPDRQKAGLVMVHGYSGNFYSGIMEYLPEALRDCGFYTLALNMRDHDQVPKRNLFEENRHDIAAAIDEMNRRGRSPVFLYGHSMGTNRVLDYLVSTKDTRIAGLILTGPPGNMFEWNVRMFGQKKATQVLRLAQELKAKGKGDEWMLVDLGPLGKTLYTANHLVSLRGPGSFSDPFKNIARVSAPVLIVHGLADRLADPKTADRLQQQAGPGAKVNVVKIAGADHSFRRHRQELADTIYKWLLTQLSATSQ
ncbi:MAG: alpha/beta fold hydrolase [Pseudomonadota bacterium]